LSNNDDGWLDGWIDGSGWMDDVIWATMMDGTMTATMMDEAMAAMGGTMDRTMTAMDGWAMIIWATMMAGQ